MCAKTQGEALHQPAMGTPLCIMFLLGEKQESTAPLWRDSKELDVSFLLKGLEQELAGLLELTSWLPVHPLAPMAPAVV